MSKGFWLGAIALLLLPPAVDAATVARSPEALAGTWVLSLDKAGTSCRVLLRAQKSDKGDFFLGLPPACRHSMPDLATVGRWSLPDAGHLALADPAGTTVLAFTGASGETFIAAAGAGTYTLSPVLVGRSAAGFAPVDAAPSGLAEVEPIASRRKSVEAAEAPETIGDTAGRYAVMRDKRDTGCMLTLDSARTTGGARAQLAPGCRDQGIVVFDPSAWQLVKGELVLTARAGHKARLAKEAEGLWTKDPKEGGKPLGLKKL